MEKYNIKLDILKKNGIYIGTSKDLPGLLVGAITTKDFAESIPDSIKGAFRNWKGVNKEHLKVTENINNNNTTEEGILYINYILEVD